MFDAYEKDGVKLDIGCGVKTKPGYTGCDLYGNPDLRFDLREPWPIENESVDTIYSSHALEHFEKSEIHAVMDGIWKALKYDSCLIAIVPYGNSSAYRGDPNHKMCWLPFTPNRFSTQFYDIYKVSQGKPIHPWVVECTYCVPHPDFKGYSEKELEFARKHLDNAFTVMLFVMRKVHGTR